MRIFLGMVLCFLTTSCATDTDSNNEVQLDGKWLLVEAQRNGKMTETLKGAYFHFEQENRLTTNITGSELSTEYKRREGKIIQKKPREIVYSIRSYSDSTMTLLTELKGTTFEFQLKRTSTQ